MIVRKNEKKNELRQQMLVAISMFVIALVALTSATYAWFTVVSTPQIKDMDMYVKTADELLFSAYHTLDMDPDGTTGYLTQTAGGITYNDPYNNSTLWTPTITKALITGELPADNIPVGFHQLTAFPDIMDNFSSIFTTANRSFFSRSIDEVAVPISYDLYEGDGTILNQKDDIGYTTFDLWVKSSKTGYVYLDMDSFVKAFEDDLEPVGGPTYHDGNEYTFRDATAIKKHIEETVRIGFYTEDQGRDKGTTAADAIVPSVSGPTAVIWEPNSKQHIPTENGGLGSTAGYVQTKAITEPGAITLPETDTMGGKTLQVTKDFFVDRNDYAETNKIKLFYLEGGKAVKVSIYFWVEGADAETINSVAGSKFRTLLQLGIDPVLVP